MTFSVLAQIAVVCHSHAGCVRRARGATPHFTVYAEAGHDSWTAAYESAELYEWLLQQRRQR